MSLTHEASFVPGCLSQVKSIFFFLRATIMSQEFPLEGVTFATYGPVSSQGPLQLIRA